MEQKSDEMFQKLENEMAMLRGISAGVIYFLDNEHAIYFFIDKITPTLRIKKTKETFKLERPAFYLHGKPIFVLKRGFPVSVQMNWNPKNMKLVEKGYTSDEIDAKIHSVYVNSVFRRRFISWENLGLIILTNALSILTTILIMKGGS